MATAARARGSKQGPAPAHLWIVGIVATLWNAFGCYDYLMTVTRNQDYLANFPAGVLTYYDSLPTWLTAFWAIGVWGGLAGSLLLLMRSRRSVLAFGLSLVGAVIGIGYQLVIQPMPAILTKGMVGVMPYVAIAVAAFLLWYAWDEDKRGVLR